MIIRRRDPATANAGALALLHGRAFGAGHAWNARALRDLREMAGAILVVASEGDAPTGFALLAGALDTRDLLTLAVDPDRQRRGIGAALLSCALASAREDGAERVLLEVGTLNRGAIALYRQAGFHEIARRANYYQDRGMVDDALVMQLLTN